MEAELEGIPEEEARKQRQRGHVRPQNGQIREQHEPQREESEVLPADLLFKGIDAARTRGPGDHVLQVPGDHQNDRHAEQQAEHGPEQARLLQIGVAGDDERTPADAGADREGPHAQRRKAGSQSPACFLILHVKTISFVRYSPVFALCTFQFQLFSLFLSSYILWSADSNTGATAVSSPRFAMPQAITMPPVRFASALRALIWPTRSSMQA